MSARAVGMKAVQRVSAIMGATINFLSFVFIANEFYKVKK
jgi:hypothetical protein